LPNRSFWLNLPKNAKSGVDYVCELASDLVDRVRGNSY
jgi:hypothetical protein